ncbi:alpha-N-arabinofuranosidase [Altererythrobacter atlanticus]|uniref:Beta-xylosidase n=1 Tax=Croceibacterium atlanticum TaxID=1267766 RepID=A0A0F7KWS0_9SPHN|nr:glycoside hydrolase family 43 protein [Croceibacterium atlanticum]AKH43250.1 Beta-xylosidase [Croceibacterium atlanticum]MBB5732044.1 alpha-N-arabinofuranosidase [Croceibacterium atlanticum]
MRERVTAAMIASAIALISVNVAAAPAASFAYLSYDGKSAPTAEDQYANPILPGFHPDPSIVKVGKDFYLVTSTFSWFPGLPVFHSRDLVNWTLIGNAIDRPGMVDMADRTLTGDGLYAPAITWHDGTFYILNTCVRCGGNFLVTANDPAGPWSDPVPLDFDGIDPSLFVDADGQGWITYNDAPQGQPRYDGHRAIWIRQFDLATRQLDGEPVLLVDGGVAPADNPVWAEGPHIYRLGEFYYLLAAEGGTADQHSQTIYRSRSITGPYEPGPINPILTQRDLDPSRPDRVEATGHADFVQLDDGSWWGVFLGTRPFSGQDTLLGRETFLLPVEWNDGWPLFLERGQAVPLVARRPDLPLAPGTDFSSWREEFDQAELGPQWLRIRGIPKVPGMKMADGALKLMPGKAALSQVAMPAFIGRRLRHRHASFQTAVDFVPAQPGDFAGLSAVASEDAFVSFGLLGTEKGPILAVMRREGTSAPANGEAIAIHQWPGGEVELRAEFEAGEARFSYRKPGTGEWRVLADEVDVSHMASVRTNLFTGVVVGPYAYDAR